MTHPLRICLVSSALAKPGLSEPAAHHIFRTACFLAREGHAVTLLHTGETAPHFPPRGERTSKHPFELIFLEENAPAQSPRVTPAHLEKSWRIHAWLQPKAFDLIHFQDDSADGFISLEAKVTRLSFAATQIGFYLHGPEQWQGEIARKPVGTRRLFNDYAVRYGAEHADHVMAPAAYFWSMAGKQDFRLASSKYVLPYLIDSPVSSPVAARASSARQSLVYFTRPGERPYLIEFLRALSSLEEKEPDVLKKVRLTFFHHKEEPDRNTLFSLAKDYLRKHLPKIDFKTQIFEDGIDCLYQLPVENTLIILSPLQAKFPYLLFEALSQKRPVLTVNPSASAFPNESDLNQWETGPLEEKIHTFLQGKVPLATPPLLPEEIESAWKNYLEEIARRKMSVDIPTSLPLPPRVSVCVSHFNKQHYLAETLESLARQTHSNFEVIVVDDRSNQPEALVQFRSQAEKYRPFGWQFIEEEENGGPGRARNVAARHANGEFLLFFDADDVAYPEMLEKLVHAMASSSIDCVGASSHLFRQREEVREIYEIGTYLGSSMEYGFLLPPAGTVCLLRPELFFALGGFVETHTLDCDEDWHFHIRLVAGGHNLQILPSPVFLYRTSLMESRSHLMARNCLNNLEPVLQGVLPWQRNLVQFAHTTIMQIDEVAGLRSELEKFKRSPSGRFLRFTHRAKKDLLQLFLRKPKVRRE